MFTKSQYELVAGCIRRQAIGWAIVSLDSENYGSKAVAGVADELCEVFAADNPKFDRARFLNACGVQS